MNMKSMIWKLRYAMRMKRRTGCAWATCWLLAADTLLDTPEVLRDHPHDVCDEELISWGA